MIPPLALLGLLALGLAAALALFFSVKLEIRAQARSSRGRLDQILRKLNDVPPPSPANAEPALPYLPLRSGMNLNKRLQAVRLLRRGEDIGHVAAALAVPRREVELLVRVQEISAKAVSGKA